MEQTFDIFQALPCKSFYLELQVAYTAKYDDSIWKKLCDQGDLYRFMNDTSIENINHYNFRKDYYIPIEDRKLTFGELIYLTTHMFCNEWFAEFHMIICPSVEMVFVTTDTNKKPICFAKDYFYRITDFSNIIEFQDTSIENLTKIKQDLLVRCESDIITPQDENMIFITCLSSDGIILEDYSAIIRVNDPSKIRVEKMYINTYDYNKILKRSTTNRSILVIDYDIAKELVRPPVPSDLITDFMYNKGLVISNLHYENPGVYNLKQNTMKEMLSLAVVVAQAWYKTNLSTIEMRYLMEQQSSVIITNLTNMLKI